jgi:hypothetical protein
MVVIEYVLVGLAGYLLLLYLGWPLWTLLAPSECPLTFWFGGAVTGLAVLQIFSWYWLDHAGSGMSTGLPVLLGLNAVAAIACLVWRRPKLRFDRAFAITAVLLIGVLAASCAIFVANFQVVATEGDHIQAASLGNNDIASYALAAQFVHDNDFHTSGRIAGENFGEFTRKDVTGVFPFVDATATISGVGDWQALLPLVLVAILLGVLALRDLANDLFKESRLRAAAVAVIASASYLYAYIQGQYFLSQILAMPLAVGLGCLYYRASEQTTKDAFFRSIAIVGLLDIVFAFTYPHMLFLAQPVLVGAVLLATVGKGWLPRATRVVVVAGGGFLVTAVVIPERFVIAVQNFFDILNNTTSGFVLYGFTPLQILGFQKTLTAPSDADLYRQGAIVLFVVAVAVAVLWRSERRAALYCIATVGLVLFTYDVIFRMRGPSYTQWKWISFFQPLYTAMTFLVVCAALAVVLRKVKVGTTLRLVGGGLAGVVVLYVVMHDTRYLTQRDKYWGRVPTQLSALSGDRDLAGIKQLNVKLPPYWEEMWGAYFVSPRTVYLRSATYFPGAPARAAWTLVPAAAQDAPGDVVRKLNADYKLIKKASS